MMQTSARLLRLLSLLQVRRDWTGADLAARLEITPRTVRRDVDKLRELGYPVHSNPGSAGGYRLEAGAAMPPLLLDDEEAVAVAIGLRTAAGGSVIGIEEASVRALAKLEQVLPPRLRSRVAGLAAMLVPLTRGGNPVDPQVLTLLAACSRDQQRLQFDYTAADGVGTRRECEPHRLVHTGRRWYLVAWDLDRADWRTYRVDRMTPRTPVGPRFATHEAPRDVARFAAYGISSGVYRYRARATLQAPAGDIEQLVSPAAGIVEVIDDQHCTLIAGGNSLDGLAIHLATFGVEFEVHEPPELVAHLTVLAGRLSRAAVPGQRSADKLVGG